MIIQNGGVRVLGMVLGFVMVIVVGCILPSEWNPFVRWGVAYVLGVVVATGLLVLITGA